MKKIIITGGSGLIGRSLSHFLSKEKFQISWLSRKKSTNSYSNYLWDPMNLNLDNKALIGQDILIQLAGSSIVDGPWTKNRKKDILDSRMKAIQCLYKYLKLHQIWIPQIIQASAIGYYGDRKSEILDEHSDSGKQGFLTEVCQSWEAEASCLKEFTDSFSIIRSGLYLSPQGGIWPKILQTKPFGFLVSFGNGLQYYSWIHYHDYNRAISFIINNQLSGIINLTAPEPIINKDFIAEINFQLKRKVIQIAAPAFVLKFLLGEKAESVLSSSFVLPKVLAENGFQFEFGSLFSAIEDLMQIEIIKSRL